VTLLPLHRPAASSRSPRSGRALLRVVAAASLAVATLLGTVGACGGDGPGVGPETGSLQVAVSGLPTGVQAWITVSGPGLSPRRLVASETLGALKPGTYVVTAADVETSDAFYAPQTTEQRIVVSAGSAPAAASVSYGVASGSLTVTINGLPAGTAAEVTVSAVNGSFTQRLTGSTTLARLRAGSYTIAATPVTSGTTTYYVVSVPATQTVTVTAGGSTTAVVNFGVPTGANLVVDGLYAVQSVQRLDRSVPLVAGRDGLVRVFVRASEGGVPAPQVRVRLHRAGQLVFERTIAPPMATAPATGAADNEGALATSWNVAVPAQVFQPGLTITAEVDPENAVPEVNEADNAYPLDGKPLDAGVRAIAPLRLRFVPVFQSANGLLGNVSGGNVEQYLAVTRRMHPLSVIEADVRAPYTTSIPALTAEDTENGWAKLLNEIQAVRASDSDAAARQYYGVVRVAYTSGVAGLGYIGFPAALGWDHLPSASEVMAHELGHNWGRFHAPCGIDKADAAYPYAGGQVGAYGYDATTGQLMPSSAPDIMGYCKGKWISDYTYNGILAFRSASAVSTSAGSVVPAAAAADATEATGAVERCLLVWGRVVNGVPTLEPAFEVDARPSLPERGGPLRLSARAANGATLWSFTFGGSEVADSPRGERSFAFTIPIARARPAQIAAIRLSAPGGDATSSVDPAAAAAGAPEVRVSRAARPSWVRVRWNAANHPVVMVRDPATGAVLSFARGGDTEVRTPGAAQASVDVVISDRIRSVGRRVTVQPQ